ncbi:glycoside hydrolase family 12 protein, partial [Fimicolochytrium jonesii]|uniref:glycoside hydrolase family 12 protein n=1 Tax=Fimicolochytrium jonesii TaxID=1396493 RepID=UPI0022FE5C93
ATLTGQWDTLQTNAGRYTYQQNLWGAHSPGASGFQSSTLPDRILTSNTKSPKPATSVSWTTTYSWTGGPYQVKSYANAARNLHKLPLTQIKAIPSFWTWHYAAASANLVADVSYDLWLSPSASGSGADASSSFEIMVWLSTRGGAGPAGTRVGGMTYNGVKWGLWKGNVGTWVVYSFVAEREITRWSGDMLAFVNYLVKKQGLPRNHYLVQAQAGTEPFVGSATLVTEAY